MRRRPAVLAAALLVSPTSVRAQAPPDEGEVIEIRETVPRDYHPADATTATKSPTPAEDVPQTAETLGAALIHDLGAESLADVNEHAMGFVIYDQDARGLLRGFLIGETDIRKDGHRASYWSIREIANVEAVEYLHGPASVLWGDGSPGGLVNLITKKPRARALHEARLSAGTHESFRLAVDSTAPLLDGSPWLGYRVNASGEDAGSFRDETHVRRAFVAPVIALALGDRTRIFVDGELFAERFTALDMGHVAIGGDPHALPASRYVGDTSDVLEHWDWTGGARLEHRFGERATLRSSLRASYMVQSDYRIHVPLGVRSDGRTLDRLLFLLVEPATYLEASWDTSLALRFSTGPVRHTLLAGVDVSQSQNEFDSVLLLPNMGVAPIDLFAPVYGVDDPDPAGGIPIAERLRVRRLGLYAQEQAELAERIVLLAGARVDLHEQSLTDLVAGMQANADTVAVSPRAGVLGRVTPGLALYASVTRSFAPQSPLEVSPDGTPFAPERGTQLEAGVRAKLARGRLAAGAAAFHLTRSNVLTPDPADPVFSVPTGEVRSRGVEASIDAEPLPRWRVLASWAFVDAEVTQDNDGNQGHRLASVPRFAFNAWTRFDVARGPLAGLGFGLGAIWVGERAGDLANSFSLPAYLRFDAVVSYRRGPLFGAIQLENLLDERYTVSSSSQTAVRPGAPFEARLVLGVRYE